MKTLKEIGFEIPGHSKVENLDIEDYLPIYDQFWTPIRNNPIKILEIGIGQRGSLRIWKEYFQNGQIFGADIDEQKLFEEDRIKTFIINQEDPQSIKELGQNLSPLDIIIDDGGHTMIQQINSIINLFEYVSYGGLYIIEDLCTSYWPHFYGGYNIGTTTIDFLKYIIDSINSTFISMGNYGGKIGTCEIPVFPVYGIESIHFYQSLVIIRKKSK